MNLKQKIVFILICVKQVLDFLILYLLNLPDASLEELKALLNPVTFAKLLFLFNPFEYQKEFFDAALTHKRIALVWGRQSGKTTAVAVFVIYFAFTHPGALISPTKILIVSKNQRQSTIMFQTVRNFLHANKILEKSVTYESRTQVILTNHSQIICLPTGHDGANIRGHYADVLIIDEAAFVKEGIIMEVCLPMLATTEKQRGTGILIMLSTPFGRDHIFYRAFMSPEFWTRKIPSKDCPLITEKFLAEQRRLIGEFRYRQEYEADFQDDRTSWYKQDLLRTIQEDYSFTNDPLNPGYIPEELILTHNVKTGKQYPHQVGLDFAKHEDYSVLVIWRIEKWKTVAGEIEVQRVVFKKQWLRECDFPKEKQKDVKVYDEVIEFLKHINQSFEISTGCADETAAGAAVVEQIQKFMPQLKGIAFSDKSKQDMQTYGRMRMEQKKVIIPSWDSDLIGQLNEQQYELSGDKILFSHPKDRHDDQHWAAILGIYSTKIEESAPSEGGIFVGPKK